MSFLVEGTYFDRQKTGNKDNQKYGENLSKGMKEGKHKNTFQEE